MSNEQILLVNSKVEIALLNHQPEEDQVLGQSLIQEVNHDSFSIMVPIKEGHTLYLTKGDEVIVSISVDNSRYTFQSEVLDKKKEANIALVVLKNPDRIIASERRDLVRIKTLLPTRYELLNHVNLSNWEDIEPLKEGYITDLSGNGLSLSLEGPLVKNAIVLLSMHLEMKNVNINTKLLGEVVRCEKADNHYRIGVKFDTITDRQQGLIINFVCHNLRRQIQIYRDDY